MQPSEVLDSDGRGPLSAHALSLLSARRPSLGNLSGPLYLPPANIFQDSDVFRPSTSQDDTSIGRSDFSRGLQIKMQDWVGNEVGKMSISPSGRDVALSTRSGLYIIDLEMPLEVPRFLPQGGTWDVADVQWNPHPSRANYVVSTSSEKLIIWNLDRPDRAAIQLILSRHYRSITDLNWHNHNPDVVASTGIDSWIWMWDLRTSGRPVTGLCAFNPGATQVKWNRYDENILASSHGSTLLIWDQRKGAVPLTTIRAHASRIYGIDWSRHDRYEIVSCSLDQTIKFWNTSSDPGIGEIIRWPLAGASTHAPSKQIDTSYPAWRARHVPFGDGILTLPQRGVKSLELFYSNGQRPIDILAEGGTGAGQPSLVKEFVWRTKGGSDRHFDDREFQLVTWSEDRTLRAWPISTRILEAAGFNSGARIKDPSHKFSTKYESYRTPPTVSHTTERIVSAPTGGHPILAGVRASTSLFSKQGDSLEFNNSSRRSKGMGTGTGTFRRGGTMTKGTDKSKRPTMHALAWMPSVTVEEKREGSGGESLTSSRLSLGLPTVSGSQERGSESPQHHPGSSTEAFEPTATPSWAEELTSVVNGLSAPKMAKVSLEKMELKKRTCTLGLQGPWGVSSSVFLRITFRFPRDYPRSSAAESLPHIELERNHLVPVKIRTFLLRELRELRKKPPCLEVCLRFLLGLPNQEGVYGRSIDTDSGSSSGEDVGDVGNERPNRDPSVTMRGQTGVAEPRTSQGVFGPNDELVCFSHMPLRMMRAMGRSISLSPSTASRAPRNSSRNNQSSGVLSDALRRLTAVAHDRQSTPGATATSADGDLLRMLESLAQPKLQSVPETPQSADVLDSAFYLRPTRKSVVSIRDVSDIGGLDHAIAKEYAVTSTDAASFCQYNSSIAHAYGRYDHERVFKTLHAFVKDAGPLSRRSSQGLFATSPWYTNYIGRNVISSLFDELYQKKDILMLAMVSVALLLSKKVTNAMYELAAPEVPSVAPRSNHFFRSEDYFSQDYSGKNRARKFSNASSTMQPHLESPTTPGMAASFSSASSRASWSSILNASASGVRFLMSGQEGSSTPKALNSPIERSKTLPVISDTSKGAEGYVASQSPESTEKKQSSPLHATQKAVGTPKSWSEPVSSPSNAPSRLAISFASMGHLDVQEAARLFSFPPQKRMVVGITADFPNEDTNAGFSRIMLEGPGIMGARLVEHVLAYGEFLFRWDLLHKRAELLKCLTNDDVSAIANHSPITDDPSPLVTTPSCPHVGEFDSKVGAKCAACKLRNQKPVCTICRLPITGLAHVCLACRHATHLRCWHSRKVQMCPTGCGCDCPSSGVEGLPRSPFIFSRVASSATVGLPQRTEY